MYQIVTVLEPLSRIQKSSQSPNLHAGQSSLAGKLIGRIIILDSAVDPFCWEIIFEFAIDGSCSLEGDGIVYGFWAVGCGLGCGCGA
jgi:hypothetical protein